MLSFQTYDGSTLLLLLILVVAVLKDWKHHRIPNWLTYGVLLSGLILQYLFLNAAGVVEGLKGAGVGLVVLLPFYLTGGMGAGDVKMMAAVGSFIGPMAAFSSACFALVAGGCVALFLIIRSGQLVSLYRRYMVILSTRTLVPAEAGSVARHRFPFSSAIAVGTCTYLGLTGDLDFYHLTTQVGYQLQAWGLL